jgi:ABC-type bacteriocin/lantibiotic exporter with double-glycine peptidase domain
VVECTTVPTISVLTEHKIIIGGIKPIIQERMACLPACLEMVMRYYGYNINQRKIGGELGQTLGGTKWNLVSPFLQRYGLKAEFFYDGTEIKFLIRNYIREQIPVIVEGRKLGMGQITHVVLIVGFDNSKNLLYFIDPEKGTMSSVNYYQFHEWNTTSRCLAVVKN